VGVARNLGISLNAGQIAYYLDHGAVPVKKDKPKYDLPKVDPLNLDALLGKPINRIAKIGIELEGGWKVLPIGTKLERDGSVFEGAGDDGQFGRSKFPGYRCGELPIGPIQPASMASALKKFYPELVNASCGMHIHMSFRRLLHYNILTSPVYQETILKYLLKWAADEGFPEDHHIWPRLRNENIYCQKQHWPDEQIKTDRKDHNKDRFGHRYTMIHYCWGRTSTIECRLLPMMSGVQQAIRAITLLLDITNACLVKLAPEDRKLRRVGANGKIILPSGAEYEEYEERV